MKKKLAPTAMELPDQLLQHAKGRSTQFVKKLRDAMSVVELEIEQHEGIYPHNGGRLTQAELCRRAGVTNVALHGPAHKETTRKMVDLWLKRVKTGLTTGRKVVRRAITDRAEAWKGQHAAVATAYHIVELELIDKNRRIQELETEIAVLHEQLAARKAKVISLKSKR